MPSTMPAIRYTVPAVVPTIPPSTFPPPLSTSGEACHPAGGTVVRCQSLRTNAHPLGVSFHSWRRFKGRDSTSPADRSERRLAAAALDVAADVPDVVLWSASATWPDEAHPSGPAAAESATSHCTERCDSRRTTPPL